MKSSPQKFGDFVEILRGDPYYEDLVKKLDSNYLQEELARKTSEYLHRSIYIACLPAGLIKVYTYCHE